MVGFWFEELFEEMVVKFWVLLVEKKILLNMDNLLVFFVVVSGKGGVGKLIVLVNFVIFLVCFGKKVGLIDVDIYGFSVLDMMGIIVCFIIEGEKLFFVECFGVKVMLMGFFVEENVLVVWRGLMFGKMLNNFFYEVEWGEVDYIVFDFLSGMGDVVFDVYIMFLSCKEIIVLMLYLIVVFVVVRVGFMVIKIDYEVVGVIENMVYYESVKIGEREYVFGKGGGDKLVEELYVFLFGRILLK